MASVEQLPFGDSRHPIRTSKHPCEWCGQLFSARGYQWQLNQRRFCDPICRQQKRDNDYEGTRRLCADCDLTKIAADFSYMGKKRQRRPFCRWCEQKNPTHKHYNGPLREAEHRCKICNGKIVAKQSRHRLKRFATCSRECAQKNRRRETIECQLCQKHLPWTQFEKTWNRALRPYCKKCDSSELVIERGFIGLRPSYHALLSHLRVHAKNHGKVFDLSTRDARKLWGQGCELCNGKVSKFVHTQRGEKIDKSTIRAMCRACAVLDKAFPLGTAGLIEQACRIARHRGAAADEPEDQGRAR